MNRCEQFSHVNAITFDLWDTLYIDGGESHESRLAERFLLINEALSTEKNVAEDVLNDTIKRASRYADKMWKEEHRTVGAGERLEFIFDQLQVPYSSMLKEDYERKIEDILLRFPPKVFTDAFSTLEQLAPHFSLAIISDTGQSPGRVLRHLLEQDDLLNFFDSFVFSNELGVAKPNKETFATTANEMKVELHHCIHVGDNVKTDVVGAINAGLFAFHLGKDDEYHEHPRYRAIDSLNDIVHLVTGEKLK